VVERSHARKRKPAAKQPTAEADPAFDTWLDVRLKTMYGSILNEPVPEDMVKLLQQRPKS
jgi:hypothetical protein